MADWLDDMIDQSPNKTSDQDLPRGMYPALRKASMKRLAGPAILVLTCIGSGKVFQSSKGAIELEKFIDHAMADRRALLVQRQNACLVAWISEGGDPLHLQVAIDAQIKKQDALASVGDFCDFFRKSKRKRTNAFDRHPKIIASSSSAAMRRFAPKKIRIAIDAVGCAQSSDADGC
ncbi:hypothetical protein [Mesorhizobium sp. L48C026A00]|uniref:hypothetical protein n=1 Tax=Mesorhizobium sp. L48C026A00 TaxID=1287182 RepID=UPI0003CFCDB3|nr:hypothetical protein [Mesorhizobium sp. L48C026A00]ESZ04442.1 hypothetical protein X737_36760 [Mesorhizobium sp. L48C026A00]